MDGSFHRAALDCFYDPANPGTPVATIQHLFEVWEDIDAVRLRLTLDPRFVDNTYGVNAIGWESSKKGTHKFKELVGSDHAQLQLHAVNGSMFEMKIDYISEDDSAASGYRSLGVSGGDGDVLEGDPAHVLSTSTSMDRNLNERGLAQYTEDSPATDAAYTPNPLASAWDFRVVYEARVDLAALPSGFDRAAVDFIHASPAKGEDNTIIVEPDDCPQDWCNDPADCPNPDPGCEEDADCPSGELCDEQGACLPPIE